MACGYDDSIFLNLPSDKSLECPVCMSVLRDPHLLSCCGSHVCQVCIELVKSRNQPCPWCREDEYATLLNKDLIRKISVLNVRCKNEGCEWKGEFKELQEHLDNECLFSEESCRHGCGKHLPRRLLLEHERQDCANRPIETRIDSITTEMFDKMSSLENRYEGEILYLKRKLNEQDVKYFEEISLLKAQIQQTSLGGQTSKDGVLIPDWSLPLPTSTHVLPPCFFTMVNYSDHKSKDEHYFTPPFYTHPCGYKFCLRVNANGDGDGKRTHVSLFVYVMKGEYDADLEWPFYGDITLQLLNWREDKGHAEKTLPFDENVPEDYNSRQIKYTRGKGWGYQQFCSMDKLKYNPDTNTEYLRNDTLCFRVSKVIVKLK